MTQPPKRIVTLGEVLMRLTPPRFARLEQANSLEMHFGGGEANVAMSLAHWGWQATHVTRFPDHALGHRAVRFLRQWGLNTSAVLWGGARLGVYYSEVGASMRASQIVYDRTSSAFADLKAGMIDWEAIFSESPVDWFHWAGITPALSQGAADVCLEAVIAAKKLGIKVSADIFYRSNLWQWGKAPQEILPELTCYTDLVVAGTGAINLIFGGQSANFAEACHQLSLQYPNLRWIADTHRTAHSATCNDLSVTLWTNGSVWQSSTLHIDPIVDRIGGGDAFIAGLMHGLSTFDNDPQDALNFGLAASALKHTVEGDVNLVSLAEVTAIAAGNINGSLKR